MYLLKMQVHSLHMECSKQCRAAIISKCIDIYPQPLDEDAIYLIMVKIDKHNINNYPSVLSIVFTARPMSFYDHLTYAEDDIREDDDNRRRILHLLPRHVFTPKHESDYRDLNWKAREAMIMLLLQINI
jgi:hypothetical protein